MSIDVTTADADAMERWDSYVEQSPQGSLFHRMAALEVQADYAGATLHPLIGRKGQEPVGLFPVFSLKKGPIRTAFSPPPDLRVPYLGPALLNMAALKRRKAERRLVQFIEGCLDAVEEAIGPKYLHVRTNGSYGDLRPFQWSGCDVTLDYTYVVDLTPGEDEVLMNFSSDARSNIRNGREAEYTIEEGGVDAIYDIVEQVRQRYESQGVSYRVPAEFAVELYERLGPTQVRPYALSVDGEFVGGMLALQYGDTVYRWQGGVRTDADVDLPVNDLLDWRVMADALDRGLERYDLVGASNRRINRYKAKFGPELQPYHSVERGTPIVTRMAKLYHQLH